MTTLTAGEDVKITSLPTPTIRVTVKQEGAPRTNQVVDVYERVTGQEYGSVGLVLVRRVWVISPDGVINIGGLNLNKKYTLIVMDQNELYNLARADMITPVLL